MFMNLESDFFFEYNPADMKFDLWDFFQFRAIFGRMTTFGIYTKCRSRSILRNRVINSFAINHPTSFDPRIHK